MNLILTSGFPDVPNARLLDTMKAVSTQPRVAWIPPFTDPSGAAFADAQQRFRNLGIAQLECVDVDEDRDEVQIAYLHQFEVVFLSDGDPVRFRYNAIRSGLAGRLRQCAAAGRLIVGNGGGGLLLTPNVSLLRLQHESVDEVLATRGRFDALAAVDYELLPHLNQCNAGLIEAVRKYSRHVDNDVVAVPDGVAIVHADDGVVTDGGTTVRYRKGQIIES
jgi:peptidase E